VTAHSLATVPALLPMGNISAASSTVHVKMRNDDTKSMTVASVASSKRMLKIKGLRQASMGAKDRFNEDA